MALHSKKDFAGLCGLTTSNLGNYIKRNQVILSGDYIDDALPINRDFLSKREQSLKNQKPPKEEKPKEEKQLRLMKPDSSPPPAPNVGDPEDEEDDEFEGGESGYALQKKKIKAEILYKSKQSELMQLRIQKIHGEVIPTELSKAIFYQHTQSIVTEFKNCVDDMVITIGKKKGLNTNEIAELKGSLIKSINTAVDKSISLTEKNLKNILSEFAEKKDVGEREQ